MRYFALEARGCFEMLRKEAEHRRLDVQRRKTEDRRLRAEEWKVERERAR